MSGAEPVPTMDELVKLLKDEPFTVANWPTWQPRFRAWFDQHLAETKPAFDQAVAFLKGQLDAKGNLPKTLNKDAVAWMLLGAATLHDPDPKRGPFVKAKQAEQYLRREYRRGWTL